MNLIEICTLFPDQESCIEHLEEVRFGDTPYCPHCGGLKVARKADGDRIGRWNCHDCKSSFNVLADTIFQKTRIDLRKWFVAIGLILNAKKGLSSYQLARDIDLNQKSAWYMMQRIRAELASKQADFLHGIVEMDETYIGGKPRKRNRRDDDNSTHNPRGRGTRKTAIVGAVERGGNVLARVADNLSGRSLMRFVKDTVSPDGSLLITDEYPGYRPVSTLMTHAVINHSIAYADGTTHTNTIEGFQALLKRAWYGQHHHYRKQYTPLYVAEACWKYNNRNNETPFDTFLSGCFA